MPGRYGGIGSTPPGGSGGISDDNPVNPTGRERYGYLTPDSFTPTDYICGVLRIPNERYMIAAFMGALSDLCKESSWESFGTMTPSDAAYMCLTVYNQFVKTRGMCMIGAVFPFMSANPPDGCLLCDGSTYLRVDYPDLYAALNSTFILDADHFTVPDLRGVVVVGANSPDSTKVDLVVGATTGVIEQPLTVDQLPAHSHTNAPHNHILTPHTHSEGTVLPTVVNGGIEAPAPSATPSIGVTGPASDGITAASITIDSTGSGNPHNNVQPSFGLSYCVVAH